MKVKKFIQLTAILFAVFVLLVANPAISGTKDLKSDTKQESVEIAKVKQDKAIKEKSSTEKKGDVKAANIKPVDINSADVKTLATLNGIGKDRAEKIVSYREKNGPFKKAEDIMKVSGIGKKLFEKNKDIIQISTN